MSLLKCTHFVFGLVCAKGNTWDLLVYFVSAASWIFPSCVDFNTVPFGSWTWRRRIVFFLFINYVFFITKYLIVSVSTIVCCEDGGDWIGCCEISLLFILNCVLTNISAPPCYYIPNILPSWGLSNVSVLL